MKRDGMKHGYTLPGFFRPTKEWDVVVYDDQKPIVVIELKSQNGPSYGNNANNRVEEALGNALDLARSIQAGYIPGNPWTGYVYVIEDDLSSREISRSADPGLIARSAEFDGWSYISRVQHLCKRLMDEQLYDATWAVATSRPSCPKTVKDPNRCPQIKKKITPHTHAFAWREIDAPVSGYARFVEELIAHLAEYFDAVTPDDAPTTGLLF
jgi:Restriction endonuclease XhoI